MFKVPSAEEIKQAEQQAAIQAAQLRLQLATQFLNTLLGRPDLTFEQAEQMITLCVLYADGLLKELGLIKKREE
jgi:hypothetical protein